MGAVKKCERCGNPKEEYLHHYCKSCLDKMIDEHSVKNGGDSV